ncbi:endonuclease/exonuclease/phosphatase family protein [Cochlodiniinecator piscidefendens]|uniref:endonuclease/exonuclease/phosphatase family protein n=1 Tax=Cochlodiniinecator piscidefendens TaxID=2715756 RepID=UPI00140C4D6E|nr:endonuclease/exonuclease/phosphatase family protein [Cochlodiniinecator piscidefendens]
MPLRIASYNIRKCIGTDRKRDPHRVLSVINEINADVIALQEADRRLGARPSALPQSLIESQSRYQVAPFALNEVSLGWHGNAVLLGPQTTLLDVDHITLPGLEPRGAVLADIQTPRGALRLIGVHLGLLRSSRKLQLDTITKTIGKRRPLPTVMIGDFNEWSKTKGLCGLPDQYQVFSPGQSFHARRPIAPLDRVAHGPEVSVQNAGVIETPLARRASDHLPIWVDVIPTATQLQASVG